MSIGRDRIDGGRTVIPPRKAVAPRAPVRPHSDARASANDARVMAARFPHQVQNPASGAWRSSDYRDFEVGQHGLRGYIDDQDMLSAQRNMQWTPTTLPASSGSRGYGGGGGGGGNDLAGIQSAFSAIMKLIADGRFNYQPDETARGQMQQAIGQGRQSAMQGLGNLRGQVGGAVAADQANAGGAYDALDQWLATQQGANPFEGRQAQAAQMDPEMEALLRSQGANTAVYGAELNALNTQGQQQADNWNSLYGVLAANEGANRTSRQTEAQLGRTQTSNRLSAAQREMEAMLAREEAQLGRQFDAEERQFMMQQAQQDAQGRQQSEREKMQIVMQLIQQLGGAGGQIPDLAWWGL
jgi:hypothetical protein